MLPSNVGTSNFGSFTPFPSDDVPRNQEDDLTHVVAFWSWESTRISPSPDSLVTWWVHQILPGRGWGGCNVHLQILIYSHWAVLDTGGEVSSKLPVNVGTVSLMTDTFFCRWESLREAILRGGASVDKVHMLISRLIHIESSVVWNISSKIVV